MKHLINTLLLSLIPRLSEQYKYKQAAEVAALESDDLLMEIKTEDNFLNVTAKTNVPSMGIKPPLKLFQFDAAEFYHHLNVTMFGSGFNFSLPNSSYDDYDYGCSSEQHAIITLITMLLYFLVCIIGLCGNTLVIYVVLRFSKMQTVTNIYILNLAIADECFLIGIPFLLYTMQTGSWQFGDYGCKAYMVSTSITQFTSSIFLVIMSVDRYIAVCHPISAAQYRTPKVSQLVSLVAWLTSVLIMLPVILFANTVQNGEHISCNIKWPEAQNTQSGTTFIVYSLFLGFIIPLAFILGFYYLVVRKLRTVGPKPKSKEKKKSHRKVTRLVTTVIAVYVLCWLLYWSSQIALICSPPSKCASRLEITVFLFAGCLGYSNSLMNPILYAFLSDNFKKSFKKACTCASRKDVNAQLQMENSLFPKFLKSKPKERLISHNKIKQNNPVLNSVNSKNKKTKTSPATIANTTSTTNTITIEASNNAAAVCPSTQMKQLLEIPAYTQPSSSSNNHQQPCITEYSNLEVSSCCLDIPEKPPVLHTDL